LYFFWLNIACPFFGKTGADVPIGKCPFLVQNSLVLLFGSAILGTKITCVIFGTKGLGIVI